MSERSRFLQAAYGLLAATLAFPSLAADYRLDPADSRLEFTANQQGADFRGRFERFDATMSLSDGNSSDNRIAATIELASVNTEYQERDEYLVGEEWFNAADYPQAQFEATGFVPDANGGVRRHRTADTAWPDSRAADEIPFRRCPAHRQHRHGPP